MKRYHHLGIPTTEPRKGETHLERFKVHVSGYETGEFGIEWMRFEPGSPVPELVRTVPHVAFEVDDLERAIAGREVLIEPNSPSEGVRVAFIVENGAPVEFLEIDSPEKIARSFVDAINAGSVERLSALMTDDHTFVDSDGTSRAGRERMLEGWKEYFALVPDYRIDIEETFAVEDTVMLTGIAAGTFSAGGALDPANHWSVPAAWRAVVDGGRVSVWQLYVNPEPMREILKRIASA